jgi:hypothetical protein
MRPLLERAGKPFNMYKRLYVDRLGMQPTPALKGPDQGRDVRLPMPAGGTIDPRIAAAKTKK